MGNRVRMLDSTPVYEAVTTQDTVTQLRPAIRKLLVTLDNSAPQLAAAVRGAFGGDDDYSSPGKPPCDWTTARPGRHWSTTWSTTPQAFLALVAGQDVGQGDDGRFRIAKKVAKDRVISTVDTEARHGHKSANRHFDGYKAHICIDPTSEPIGEVAVTAANAPDADAVADLLASHADDDDKPEVTGDSAYGSAAAGSDLEDQCYPVTA